MIEKNIDFDKVIDRKNTGSLKYDSNKREGMPEDVLPLWVADMDFRTSSFVTEALDKLNAHGIFGYSEADEQYFIALKNWMKKHHEWDIEEKWLTKTPGVVFALAMAVRAYTKENDAVLIQPPVYYPFGNIIKANNRKTVTSALKQDNDGRYHMDYEDFEKKIVTEKVKMFILCSPHNPVGRVWTEEELRKAGDICFRHNVLVVSDEIHGDFAFRRQHTVFTNVREEYKDMAVVCTSPSKTFNIAGLQVSNILISNDDLRRKFRREVNSSGYGQLGLPALAACEAAYAKGQVWFNEVLMYIKNNASYVEQFLKERLPKVRMVPLEGTYLVWLDFRAYGLSESELNDRIVHKAGLWLDSGSMFGVQGQGFQRINIACPRRTLTEAMERLASAF